MSVKPKTPEDFFPEGAFSIVADLFHSHSVRIKVVKSRTTKFADFNPPDKRSKIPVITINNNLNPYFFLITLLHEFAHFLVWKNGHNYAKPHGLTWKNYFKELMQVMIDKGIFPEILLPDIIEHIQNPKATSCTDIKLFKKLSAFDNEKKGIFIDDLPDGTIFQTPEGHIFKKEKKVRKRILCISRENRKKYLFSPVYKVFPLSGQQYVIAFP